MGPTTETDVEALTREYGRAIFSGLRHSRPLLFTPGWWDERLMQWSTDNEAVKVQLFRFIDVLPMLRAPADISRHLREYFAEAGPALPRWLDRGLKWLPTNGLAGKALAWATKVSARRMARRFIAGSNVQEVVEAIARLRGRSLAFTVDLLGEATVTEAEADRYAADCRSLIESLGKAVNDWPAIDLIDCDHQGAIPRVNVSVKLSSLYSQFDPIDPEGTSQAVRARLRPILRLARDHRAFINIDMEQYAFKNQTLRIFREVLDEEEFRDWSDVGIAIQAYLRDSEADLKELLGWVERRGTPIWVRLVKGAYWDYETTIAAQQGWPVPVYQQKWESDASFERLTRFLMQHCQFLRPALASHNVRSLAHGLAWARTLGLPSASYEIQMLYGMADPVKERLVEMGQRVRVYTPYGELLPGMAYLVRRLLENTANESFLRASFTERVPEEQLLMNPTIKAEHEERRTEGQQRIVPGGDLQPWIAPCPPPADHCFVNEPLTDFSRASAREAMQRALADVAGQLGRSYPLVIGSEAIDTEARIQSINPSHVRQIVGFCARAGTDHARQAIEVATVAFAAWRDTDPARRAAYLFRAAEVMRKRRFELSAWEVYECGKPWREADADVAESIDYCEYYAREMLRLSVPRRRDVPGETNEYFYEPRGVTVVIAPWNFPLAILCGMTTAALVTGNTVIMKPAEQSSVVGAKLMEVFRASGLPPGVVNYLPGVGEEIGPVLVKDPDVAMIAFTGSKHVGLHINRTAAETPPGQTHVKRVLAEMGGKNAIIIDDDADLDEAVHGVVHSAFGYQGQKCSACSRVIVLDALHDVFLSRLVEATRSLRLAPAEDPGCFLGPVIDADAQQRILEYIDKGKEEARLVYPDGPTGPLEEHLAQEGCYVMPHIFAEVPPQAVIAQQEIFGPVLAVLRARDLEEALDIANGTEYALTGGLFSRSPDNIAKVKRRFRVGNLYINRKCTGALADRQPFGGFKLSGIGTKAGGPDYLLQFMMPRNVTENTLRRGFAPST